MTRIRKIKIEHQKARKVCIAKLKELNEERRQLQPEKSPTPIPELEGDDEAKADAEIATEEDPSNVDTEDEEIITARSLRRGNDRATERKRKREEEAERKAHTAEAKQSKGSKEYQRCLKAIEKEREKIEQCEDAIADVDNDLREADSHRTRVLGKDRFWNRYYWFERNAMPYEGLGESSTADAEFANGRIWVQGPDDMERLGFIKVTDEEEKAYFRTFQMTPSERKKLEEGDTNVFAATQWGYCETPEDIEMLIGWLDPRGSRELKLRKELSLYKENIARYMQNRSMYLNPPKAEDGEDELPQTRMSTRTKTYVSEKTHRCLRWRNDTALRANGHRHVDPPPKPRGKGSKKVVIEEPLMTRAAVNRMGKPLTRQGTRYNF